MNPEIDHYRFPPRLTALWQRLIAWTDPITAAYEHFYRSLQPWRRAQP
ncbi:hypothetical protein [Nocardia arthritidis]|uniref:Uncharacterized protein n=1 Tax=Nocardia arthritidis TaxID=228602 RepID=A0A6G9YKW7_9NOCA|nr:hypothetical protein [Nocardia arthritidis]QIS13852.1 hypothetical protein F5544_30035 [Nocardia arthritidis]